MCSAAGAGMRGARATAAAAGAGTAAGAARRLCSLFVAAAGAARRLVRLLAAAAARFLAAAVLLVDGGIADLRRALRGGSALLRALLDVVGLTLLLAGVLGLASSGHALAGCMTCAAPGDGVRSVVCRTPLTCQ